MKTIFILIAATCVGAVVYLGNAQLAVGVAVGVVFGYLFTVIFSKRKTLI